MPLAALTFPSQPKEQHVRHLVITAALGVILLTGCGAVTVTAAKSPPPTAPAKSTTTTTTVVPFGAGPTTTAPKPGDGSGTPKPGDYANQYIGLVTPANCALGSLNALLDQGDEHRTDWVWFQQHVLPAAAALSNAYTTLAAGLTNATWPPDLQHAVDNLAAIEVQRAQFYKDIASATDFESYNAAWDMPYTDENHDSATAVRTKLGLPPSADDAADYCPGTVA